MTCGGARCMEHLRPVAKAEAQATVTDAVRAWPQPCVVGWVVWHMVACLFVIPVVELRCWIKVLRECQLGWFLIYGFDGGGRRSGLVINYLLLLACLFACWVRG
jgi:hypothetical protein